MKCPVHSDKDVVGYCIECGAFGCNVCLVPKGRGESLCVKCEKALEAKNKEKKGLFSKFRAEKETQATASHATGGRSSVARKTGTTRKLIIHFKNGRVLKGTTYKLDPRSLGFYLVPLESTQGQDRIFVHFSDLKAIYFVRDFEGKFDPAEAVSEPASESQEVKIMFDDGEVVEGRILHHFDPACLRFFMVPVEENTNNISMLVERSALKGMEMDGFREGIFAEEEGVAVSGIEERGRAPLSQSESMGDVYFSMKNYNAALAEYEKVQKEHPHDKRLALKISVCNFNRGVNFIKSRKYHEAKSEFEKIAEDDPIYEKAKKKIRKIEKILKEVQSLGA